jgi:L-iditol 2-dehydrogenase
MCLSGRFNLCLNFGHEEIGHRQYGHYSQGAYAQYIQTSIKSIARVPDDMSFNTAATMDPLSIALHVVERSGLKAGDTLLVNGTGPQGLFSITLAKHMGAGKIIAAGSGFRLKVAEKLGAIPIDYKKEDVVARVKELTGGMGAARVLECAGTPQGVRNACDAVAKGGRVSMVGIPATDISLPVKRIVLEEIEIVGNRANPNTLERAIGMTQENKIDMESFITHEFALEDFATAYDVFVNRKDNSLKVAIKPNN